MVGAMKESFLCLRDLPLFQGLTEKEFHSICPGIVNKSVAKGESLFHQGQDMQTIYLVKSGKLKLLQNTEDGREVIIGIAGLGEVLGETALFQGCELNFSAVAIEDTKLCGFSRADLEMVIQQNPGFAVKIISHLAAKLNLTLQQVTETSGASVKEKLLRLLIRLANEHGKTMYDMIVIELNLTQQEIANMIGASRVKVAQVLKELKEAKIVDRKGSFYTLKTDFCVQDFTVNDMEIL